MSQGTGPLRRSTRVDGPLNENASFGDRPAGRFNGDCYCAIVRALSAAYILDMPAGDPGQIRDLVDKPAGWIGDGMGV